MDRSEAEAYSEVEATSVGADDAPEAGLEFSSSVRRATSEILDHRVSAATIVASVRRLHPEYGGGWPDVDLSSLPVLDARTGRDWLAAVAGIFGDATSDVVDGRMAVVGLALLDPALQAALGRRFLEAVVAEDREGPGGWERFPEGVRRRLRQGARVADGAVPTHLDLPATEDRLGRRGFAEALVRRLRALYAGRGLDLSDQGSFMLHLDGPWGSGKSSLLNFMREGLEGDATEDGAGPGYGPWVVVEYNAWRHQRVGPPWWWLLSAVRSGAVRALRRQSPLREAQFVLGDVWWRLKSAGWVSGVFAAGLLYLIVSNALIPRLPDPSSKEFNVRPIADFIALLTTAFSLLLALTRTLLPSSVRGAEGFMQWSKNPARTLSERFEEIVAGVGMPIAVLIDDLDRCQAPYVVELLEGVQTMFRNAPVVYVVAADGRWLQSCFEGAYPSFSSSLAEAGRPLGRLFMEKLFQLSATVPEVSAEVRRTYWSSLVLGTPEEGATRDEARAEAVERLKGATDERGVLEIVRTESQGDPTRARLLREEAVRRLSTAAAQAQTEHLLLPFAELLEPNPRSMKRLVNAYSVQRDLNILAGAAVEPELMARWTILTLRWPTLSEELGRRARAKPEGPIVLTGLPDALGVLFASKDVQAVLTDEAYGPPLDADGVRGCVGILGKTAAKAPVPETGSEIVS